MPEPRDQLAMLTALGFGPDTVLMNDPKLFVDGRFLASLLVELEDELGPKDARLALFQIGLLHGLRDAARICGEQAGPDTTALVLQWHAAETVGEGELSSYTGHWPERHEASARLSRLGSATTPSCWMSAGYTSGWLSGTLDRPIVALEVECAASDHAACRFDAREVASWRSESKDDLEWLLGQVPFDVFRQVAERSTASDDHDRVSDNDAYRPPRDDDFHPSADTVPEGRFDRSQPVVHIWGPVMVLPFTTLDEALGTVDMLGRDPGISEIRAVVIDLREQSLDEGFGAAALEQILETVESWDAQSLITGVSIGAEPAISSIEASHLVLRKDLPDAIATAFQIADAQRHHV